MTWNRGVLQEMTRATQNVIYLLITLTFEYVSSNQGSVQNLKKTMCRYASQATQKLSSIIFFLSGTHQSLMDLLAADLAFPAIS